MAQLSNTKKIKGNVFDKPGDNTGDGISGSHSQHTKHPAPADNPGHGSKGGDQY